MVRSSAPDGRVPPWTDAGASAVLARQDGVVTTAQLQAWGTQRSLVARRVQTGQWQRLFRGVVVLHSGPVTWRQRARGGLLCAGPDAALSHQSAGFLHGLVPRPGSGVVVSIPAARAVTAQPGLVVHRRDVMPFAGGRLRAVNEDATVLDLLDEVDSPEEVVGLVCDAIRHGLLPGRILVHARERRRLRHRGLLLDLLGETGRGIESPLEYRYALDVERRHDLPTSRAQVSERVDGRWIRADRVYTGHGVRVELDGQLAHPFGRTDDDTWRDNAVLVERSEITLRYRWRHVAVDPCATAGQVATALRAHGWTGRPSRCSATCRLV